MNGVSPTLNLSERTISTFTQKRVLEIVSKTLLSSVASIGEAIELIEAELGQKTKVGLDQPEFVKRLNRVNFVDRKRKIFAESQVTADEPECESPTEVFTKINEFHRQ